MTLTATTRSTPAEDERTELLRGIYSEAVQTRLLLAQDREMLSGERVRVALPLSE